MFARICTAGFLSLLFACGGGGKQVVKAPADTKPTVLAPAEVVTAIKGQLEQYRQAYKVRSLEALEPIYSHGPELAITYQGTTRRGWEQVRPYLKALLRDNSDIRLAFSEVRVAALGGGGAAVTLTLKRGLGDGSTLTEETGTLDLAFRLDGKRWVIVHEHFSYASGTQ